MQFEAKLESYLHRNPSAWWFVLCLVLITVIAISDYATGYELSLSILYLVPVVISTWILGRDAGITVSMISSAAWLITTSFLSHPHTHPFYFFWDAAIKFVTFALFATIISRLKIALSHADERFVTVLEGLDAAVFVTDADGHLLYANEQFQKAVAAGSALEKAATQPIMPSPHSHISDKPDIDVFEGEFHDAGSGRWYLIRTRTIRWVDGTAVRLRLATDITERKQARALYRQQQEKLQMTARLITIGEMASTLAHEINQPLAAIANYNMGCVRRMRAGDWNREELLAAMEKAGAQAERAGRVIGRVRSLIRKREPAFAPCGLNQIIEGVAALIEIDAEKNAVELVLDLAPGIPPAKADAVMIEQVVLNLIKNGIEAMQDASAQDRQLVIRSMASPQGIEVAIADNGCGIDSQLEGELFTSFFTTKLQGTGMGLHICRSIIEMHAGRLWYERNPTGGSIFHFSLPVAQP